MSVPEPAVPSDRTIAWWSPALMGALAGGMGWGIRGQYGHETGAMIAGVLVAFTLALHLARHLPLLQTARAIAWCTTAIGIGGSMTYGQTIGLTQNAGVIGRPEVYAWGMLGLALKGALWIGFAGAFLGMGLGPRRYRPLELAALLGSMLLLFFLGTALLNAPFDPAQRTLPRIYFSADWRWEPGAELKPRREVWGGYLMALGGLLAYLAWVRRDPLAWRLGAWGLLGGSLGFPAGQSIQAYHAWHPERFTDGVWRELAPVVNWWNMMETTFGLILGACLGFGLWLHRHLILPTEAVLGPKAAAEPRSWSAPLEWITALVHGAAILAGEFSDWPILGAYTEMGLVLVILPVLGIAGGRWWPFLLSLPLTMLPIAAKTVREISATPGSWPIPCATVVLGVVPVGLMLGIALWFARRINAPSAARSVDYCRAGLLFTSWSYFLLNYTFFQFPWPWQPWTPRTPNALIFTVCLAGLTWAAWRSSPKSSRVPEEARRRPLPG